MSHHEDVLLQLENMSLLELKLKSPMFKQSLAAFSFAKQRHTSGTRPLFMTPTAGGPGAVKIPEGKNSLQGCT